MDIVETIFFSVTKGKKIAGQNGFTLRKRETDNGTPQMTAPFN